MDLNLRKPIAFIDLETTGLSFIKDKIIEIAILKIEKSGDEKTLIQRLNPGFPIPPESTFFHHIVDEDVKDKPTFKEFAPTLLDFIKDCDLAGYNSNKFDIPMLVEEILNAGFEFDMKNRLLIDVQNIFHKMEQRTLKAAYKFYCSKDLVNAHSAIVDISATKEIFMAQLERYDGAEFENSDGSITYPIVNDMSKIAEFTSYNKNVDLAGQIIYNEEGNEVFNFGKHKGKLVTEIFAREPQYYDWIMNAEFPAYTKRIVQKIRLKNFNNGNVKI